MSRAPLRPAARLPYAPAMSPGAIRLSKSRVMAGLQCHKRLWWTVHEPSAPELQPDVAEQAHVLGHCGVDASRLEIMHLNRVCAYPDLSNLFIRADVTAQAHDALEAMPGVIQAQPAMLAGPLPDVAIGEHCRTPYERPFMARCWPALPPHHVSTLYSAGRRALLLEEQGYATIRDLPEDFRSRPSRTGS